MSAKPKNYYQAVAVLVGYIIGVGMFGLPFVVAHAGVGVFFAYLIGLCLIQYFLHLIYANVIVTTKELHRLPGYAEIYLGQKGKYIAFIAKVIGNMGALLAYIIIVGIFLNELLNPVFGGSEFIYSTLVFVIGAIIVFFGIKMIAKFELIMTILLLLVVGLIVWRGVDFFSLGKLPDLNWLYVFLPYGVMLAAIDGSGSLPIVAKLLNKDPGAVKSVVRWGMGISIFVITIFTLMIVGISGTSTTPDALVGVKQILSDGVVFFSLIFGVLTITTSFLLVSESVKETLWWDFKFDKKLAWAIAVFVPYISYVLGARNLTEVISFAGGAAGGLAAIILILIFSKLKKRPNKLVLFKHSPSQIALYFLIVLFVLGIIYETYYFFS